MLLPTIFLTIIAASAVCSLPTGENLLNISPVSNVIAPNTSTSPAISNPASSADSTSTTLRTNSRGNKSKVKVDRRGRGRGRGRERGRNLRKGSRPTATIVPVASAVTAVTGALDTKDYSSDPNMTAKLPYADKNSDITDATLKAIRKFEETDQLPTGGVRRILADS